MEKRQNEQIREEGGPVMGTLSRPVSIAFLFLLATYGCATYDSAVPASTGIGAASGALIGYGLTGTGAGAAAGAGAGALAGALTGVAIDESRRTQPPPPRPYPPAGGAGSGYAPSPTHVATVDPTRGEMVNRTGWRLLIYVDDSPEPIWMEPWGSKPTELDVGPHEIVANAYVDTRFGERRVGTYRRQIHVDPQGSGWSLRFEERMFR